MIKKTKESQYYNPDWPVYVCPDCGDEFYFKFQDSDKCFSCQSAIHNAIAKRLEQFHANQKQLNIEYSQSYRKRK